MKNLFKVFGIIAISAIMGFSFAACGGGGGGGTLTVTGIPAKVSTNGIDSVSVTYAWALAQIPGKTFGVYGANTVSLGAPGELTPISGGKASMPTWIINDDDPLNPVRYSGNDTLEVTVTLNQNGSSYYVLGSVVGKTFTITFRNGSATVSWNDGR